MLVTSLEEPWRESKERLLQARAGMMLLTLLRGLSVDTEVKSHSPVTISVNDMGSSLYYQYATESSRGMGKGDGV